MKQNKRRECSCINGSINQNGMGAVVSAVLGRASGCDWFVNSAEYNYCFWNMMPDLYNNPLSDREICQLLCITEQELEQTYQSAIKKLRDKMHEADVAMFFELIQEKINRDSETCAAGLPNSVKSIVYAPESTSQTDEREGKGKADGRGRPRKGFGMPLHLDKKKVDLYGLSRRKNVKKDDPSK